MVPLLEDLVAAPVHEGRILCSDVDVRTHQTVKQDVQVASAAHLEGEETRMPTVTLARLR